MQRPHALWQRRLPRALVLGIGEIGLILLSIFWYIAGTPRWGFELDRLGPQPFQTCQHAGFCTVQYSWRIQSITFPSPAADYDQNTFLNAKQSIWICAYQAQGSPSFQMVTLTTSATQIDSARAISFVSGESTCERNLQKIAMLPSVPWYLAFIDFSIALLSGILAFLVVLHSRLHLAEWLSLVFLASTCMTLSLIPTSINQYTSFFLIVFVAPVITIPSLACLLVVLLVWPLSKQQSDKWLVRVWCGLLVSFACIWAGDTVLTLTNPHRFFERLDLFDQVYTLYFLSIFVAVIVGNLRRTVAIQHETARLLLLAMVISFGPFLVYYISVDFLKPTLSDIWGVFATTPVIVLPLTLAYIMLRRQLIAVDTFIHRSIVPTSYLLLTFCCALVAVTIVKWQLPRIRAFSSERQYQGDG